MKRTAICAALAALVFVSAAQAVPLAPLEAFDNATVQPAGPRSGSSGKAFFNMEGSNNGNFASYGVADFDLSALVTPGTVVGINSATLSLTQSNAAFSTDGPLSFYLTQQTSVGIQPGDTTVFVSGNDGEAAIDTDLKPVDLLATSAYVQVASGQVDTFNLTFSGASLTYLLNQINSGGTLRLIVTPDDPTTAATYAGFSNNTYAGPTLSLDVSVPEPASVALALVGALALLGLARKTR